MRSLFGTDGVRGIANKDLTIEFAMNLGIATAVVLTKKQKNVTIAIGRDTRISGDMLASCLIAGLTSLGVNIIDLGVIPTPGVSYLIKKYKAQAGIMVSASHNPWEYNGIKIFDRMGYKLPDALEDEIEDVMDNIDKFKKYNSEVGKVIRGYNPVEDYVNHLVRAMDVKLDGLKIAVDCANGSSAATARMLFDKLGCDYTIFSDVPDGININDNCGSTHIEVLSKYVASGKFDCGIAYDGDADRCIMVDEVGNVIDGDFVLAVMAMDMKKSGKLVNNTVVGTVMSNLGLVKFCHENGINFVATKVGDRYVLEEMLLKGYVLGGEQSGHVIFKEYANTGDGELTSIKILEIMKKSGKKLSELVRVMKKYPQVLINVPVDNSKKNDFYTDDEVSHEIDKVSNLLSDNGRVLVRPSGTEPLIRVMIEGADEEVIGEYAKELADKIKIRLS
jgi:phosphoglucosamine mutase